MDSVTFGDCMSRIHIPIRLFVLCLALRLAALPFAQVIDADAVTRVFDARDWLQEPYPITEGIWLPLHKLFLALCVWVSGSVVEFPVLVHALCGAALAVPAHALLTRAFPNSPAWPAALFFGCTPVLFHNSFHTLTGVPTALLILCALNAFHRMIQNGGKTDAIKAGAWLTIACGFRYEAWLLLAVLTGMGVLFSRTKLTALFWVVSMLVPAYWMTGNYLAHGDLLYGLTGAYRWNIILSGTNDNISEVDRIQRCVFFAWSWWLNISPLLALLLAAQLIRGIRRSTVDRAVLWWTLPWLVFMFTFTYKAWNGTLFMQHRFTGLLLVLSWPILGWSFAQIRWNTRRLLMIGTYVVLLVPMSYVHISIPFERLLPGKYGAALGQMRGMTAYGLEAIPRCFDQSMLALEPVIQSELNETDGLILDFVQWESTYHQLLHSGVQPYQYAVVSGAKHDEVHLNTLIDLVHDHPNGIVVMRCNSALLEVLVPVEGGVQLAGTSGECLELQPLAEERDVTVFRYAWKPNVDAVSGALPKSNCPLPGSAQFYQYQIEANRGWYSDIARRARQNNLTTAEMVRRESEWISTH